MPGLDTFRIRELALKFSLLQQMTKGNQVTFQQSFDNVFDKVFVHGNRMAKQIQNVNGENSTKMDPKSAKEKLILDYKKGKE